MFVTGKFFLLIQYLGNQNDILKKKQNISTTSSNIRNLISTQLISKTN